MSPSGPISPKEVEAARKGARPITQPKDFAPLIERIKDSKVVMLGESSHGTQEFYEWRRLISEWLITKHGFNFIAVEGDWPACQTLNDYVLDREGHLPDARRSLESFRRWPTWMWANTEVSRLAEWMRTHNLRVPRELRAGFYGFDVYSFFESMHAVLEKVSRINPMLARRIRNRYACFDPFSGDEIAYARSLFRNPEGCEDEVVGTLTDLLKTRLDGLKDREDILFDAQQNARIVRNAENYYRTMIHGNEDSWNVRDRHMMETLDILLERHGPDAKGIVWAHNTHIGDYRATDMVEQGQINVGGLAREKYGEDAVSLVGFGTHRGSVIASHAWDGPIEKMRVPPGREGSTEDLLHQIVREAPSPNCYFIFDESSHAGPLAARRGHRAIGVVYDPRIERWGNYVPTDLTRRYDAFIFCDESRALEPIIQGFDSHELPETWPAGQ